MKRKILMIFWFSLLLIFTSMPQVNAFDEYSIDIPENYTEGVQNVFIREDQNNFNIQIDQNATGEFYYNEQFLNEIVDTISNQISDLLEANREGIREKFKDTLTKEQIDDIIDSIKFKGIVSKEVTTFTQNNYPALHFVLNYSMKDINYLAEIYQTASDNKIYTLTFTQIADGYLESDEVKNITKSFTIKNYVDVTSNENVKGENAAKKITTNAVLGAVVGMAIASIIGVVINKRIKKKF